MLWKSAFFVVALAFSVFYGRYAVDLFQVNVERTWPTRYWHFWVNFIDSAVGWAIAYYFVVYRLIPVRCYTFKLEDTVLIAISLLGVTGFLPYVLGTRGGLKGG